MANTGPMFEESCQIKKKKVDQTCPLLQVHTGLEKSRGPGRCFTLRNRNQTIVRSNDFKGHGLLSEVLWTLLDSMH